MRDHRELGALLRRLNGKGYGAYKEIGGAWRFPDFILFVDHVQGDPFATPSRFRVQVPMEVAAIPRDFYRNKPRKIALEDFLVRGLTRWIPVLTKGTRGSGHSGRFSVVAFGQCILHRTAVWVTEDHVEAILSVGLPAAGRRILGHEAAEMLLSELPALVQKALTFRNLDKTAVREHVACGEERNLPLSWGLGGGGWAAGSPAARTASTASSDMRTAVRGRIHWPKSTTENLPEWPEPRLPLVTSGMARARARTRKSSRAIRRGRFRKSSGGRPATSPGTWTLRRLGAANGSPWTWSM